MRSFRVIQTAAILNMAGLIKEFAYDKQFKSILQAQVAVFRCFSALERPRSIPLRSN